MKNGKRHSSRLARSTSLPGSLIFLPTGVTGGGKTRDPGNKDVARFDWIIPYV